MQFQVRESDDSCQPRPPYTNPRVVVQEHHGAPLLNCSGLVLVRQLIERLGVARAIDAGVRVLRRCKWYRESDHILTLIYSMLSGGSKLQDVNRLGQDGALKRVLGSDRIPHATTIGKFLWRFGDDQQDQQRQGLAELRETTAAVQQDAFGLLARERRKVATLDWDSSIHEVYGQKKEGADFAYDNTWSYSALYATLAETGDVLYLGLREGYRHTSYGTKEVLPGTIERVSKHFRTVRMRADSGYRLQFVFQPLLSLYRLAVHSAVVARLPSHLYDLAPQLGYLAPARRRTAVRTPPESSHPSSLSTPIRVCPAAPHR